MHGVLIDARSQHGLTVTADEGTQANLGTARVDAQGVAQVEGALTADASTDSAEQPAGDTLESRHADLKQLEAAAQAAQEELLQANSMTQTIRSKHATEIQQLIALVKPFEQESEKLQQSAQTGWRLVLGDESVGGTSHTGVSVAAEAAIFERVEREMKSYGIVGKTAQPEPEPEPEPAQVAQGGAEGARAGTPLEGVRAGTPLVWEEREQSDWPLLPDPAAAEDEAALRGLKALEEKLDAVELKEMLAAEMRSSAEGGADT